jgi:hypothetical protein
MRLLSVTLAVLLTLSGGESSTVMARQERRGDEDTTHGVEVHVQDSEEGRLDTNRMDLLDSYGVPEEVTDVDENVTTTGNLRASSSHDDELLPVEDYKEQEEDAAAPDPGAGVEPSLLDDGVVGGGGVMEVGTAGYDFETQVLLAGHTKGEDGVSSTNHLGGSCFWQCRLDSVCQTDTCPSCIAGMCSKMPPINCIGNEGALRTALQAGGAHTLCPQIIVVSREIVSSASRVELSCEGTGCTIQASGMNRIMNLSGSYWKIKDITFYNGGGVDEVRPTSVPTCVSSSSAGTFSVLQFGITQTFPEYYF